MGLITKAERDKLYLHVKHELGFPLRPFEIKDDMMNSYLEMVVEDYSAILNNWLTEQQWVSLEGMEKGSDFTAAYSYKTNKYMKSFTYAYSKQVGLGTNAPADSQWELKRDFITTVADTQHYVIPAGRQVNEVLWETPPAIDGGQIDPFALSVAGNNIGGTNSYSRPGLLVSPVFSTLLTAQDRRMKQRMLQSTLTYRITGLESGEKLLHLYPVPGSRYEIKNMWNTQCVGKKVWYWYYETTPNNEKKCLKANPDVVRLPSENPINVLQWSEMNDTAKQQIRNLLIAKVKMVIGGIRGFYTGNIGVAEKELTLDYRHLLEEGQKLKEDTQKTILDTLDKLSQVNLTKTRAEIAENVNNHLRFQPFTYPIISI